MIKVHRHTSAFCWRTKNYRLEERSDTHDNVIIIVVIIVLLFFLVVIILLIIVIFILLLLIIAGRVFCSTRLLCWASTDGDTTTSHRPKEARAGAGARAKT